NGEQVKLSFVELYQVSANWRFQTQAISPETLPLTIQRSLLILPVSKHNWVDVPVFWGPLGDHKVLMNNADNV
ncbi:hypothetical protein, partial [Citrobacter freundii]|uniref:hypothetical protein n=1 Tax=Citrobacter freundii TaxID=546 RepID=UPI001CD24618